MSRPFYLTTPLYYVNARPHIGHAYTTIVADTLARWRRQRADEVFLLTGTDEHGEKVAQSASKEGVSPKQFADRNAETFKSLWKRFGISYDYFIRTTDLKHERVVQQVLDRLKPHLELGRYTFWYCVPCETNWGLSEVEPAKKLCPQCRRPVSQVVEEDYFLPLEKHRVWLKEQIQNNKGFILPASRRNEVLAMLEKELPPLCITRPRERVPWGIEVPFSPGHVTYVWFDALLNYISALGWPDGQEFRRYWTEAGAVHLVGKDIIRHHALYWPIILHALGVPPPKTIFAHGWWLIQGEKMSKSKGNVVDPDAVAAEYGMDALRYFLLRDVPFGEDGIFSEEALVKRINADLANDLGNLVYRTLTMIEKHADGAVPQGEPAQWQKGTAYLLEEVDLELSGFAFDRALKAIWDTLVSEANDSVERHAPWNLARQGKRQELALFLYQMAESVRRIALLIWPFMPQTGESIWRQLGYESPISQERLPEGLERQIPPHQRIRKEKPLFPRLETEENSL